LRAAPARCRLPVPRRKDGWIDRSGRSNIPPHLSASLWREVFMRILIFSLAAVLCSMASAAPAQQASPTTGDAIGHPPPIPGPPPLSEPSSATPSTPTASTPRASEPASKGSTGAVTPAGAPPTPYSTGPLPLSVQGPGRNVVAADGVSTRTVKAVPCGVAARETDGSTTCVGIPDQSPRKRRR
jgi:hypothetical protein